VGIRLHDVWDVLSRFSESLVGAYELDKVMADLGRDVCQALGVAGAGVMLADEDGRLSFVTTSDDSLARLETLQLELGEGPCLLAYRTNELVVCPDLAGDPRFPHFGPRATALGMAAVYSFPMSVDSSTCIGGLNLYDNEPGVLGSEEVRLGTVFAEMATAFLVHAHDLQQREVYTAGLQQALSSRVVVEQAKGFLSAALGVDTVAAFGLLRRYSRSRQRKVHDVARDLLDGRLTPTAFS
jgi:GAF domain-containing protein